MAFKSVPTQEEKVTIRQARVTDYDKVKSLLVDAGLTTDEFFTRVRFIRTLHDFGKYNLVAKKEGKLVGYISGFDDSGKSGEPKFYGYLGRWVVDPSYRHKGIGKELLERSIEEFRRSGYAVIFAGVKRDNLASKTALEKVGFGDDGYLLLIRDQET